MLGYVVFSEMKADASPLVRDEVRNFYSVAYKLAKRILLVDPMASTDDASFDVMRVLHSVVACEVDADRIDYCLRDPHSCGVELGALDVSRLIGSLTLIRRDGGRFELIPTDKSLSAIESFFHQRYLIYRYIIHHHNVARMDGIVEEVLFRLFNIANRASAEWRGVCDLLKSMGLWDRDADAGKRAPFLSAERWPTIDDAWLRVLFAQVLPLIPSSERAASEAEAGERRTLKMLIDTVLHRRSENLVTIWKRETDVAEYIRAAADGLDDAERTSLNESRPFTKLQSDSVHARYIHMVDKLRRALLEQEVVLVSRRLIPRGLEETEEGDCLLRVLVRGQPLAADEVSAYLRSLMRVASETPAVHLSCVGHRLKIDKAKQDQALRIVKEHINAYLIGIATDGDS